MRLALVILALAFGIPAYAQRPAPPVVIVPMIPRPAPPAPEMPAEKPEVRGSIFETPAPPTPAPVTGSLFDAPAPSGPDARTARSAWGEPTVPNPQGLALEPSPESTYMRVWRAVTRAGCHEDWLFQFAWWNGIALDLPIPDHYSTLHLPQTIDDCSKQPPPPEQNMSAYIRRMEALRLKVDSLRRPQ